MSKNTKEKRIQKKTGERRRTEENGGERRRTEENGGLSNRQDQKRPNSKGGKEENKTNERLKRSPEFTSTEEGKKKYMT